MVSGGDERSPTVARPPRPGPRLQVVYVLPAIAFLATFGLFFVDKSREARTVLRSGRGLLAVAAIVGGYLVIALALRRFARRAWVAPLTLTAVVLGLAAWIVRPYYLDETADRTLVTGVLPDAPPPAGPAPPEAPAAPTRVSRGALTGLGHDAEGEVALIRTGDGSLVVRFQSFDIEGTPDPRVHLVPESDARRAGGVELGRLPGNRGRMLDIPVPAGTSAGPGWTVLVWCRAFSVPIANATQAAT